MKELVALAQKRPGELTWAVASIVGGGRLGGELFKTATGIDMTVVPYGGGAPAVTAVLGGHTSMLVGNMPDCAPYVASGRMRAIAVTSAKRSEQLPNVPTVAEQGYPGFNVINWFGAVVRSGTPRGALERLNAEIGRGLQLPEVKETLTQIGMTPVADEPGRVRRVSAPRDGRQRQDHPQAGAAASHAGPSSPLSRSAASDERRAVFLAGIPAASGRIPGKPPGNVGEEVGTLSRLAKAVSSSWSLRHMSKRCRWREVTREDLRHAASWNCTLSPAPALMISHPSSRPGRPCLRSTDGFRDGDEPNLPDTSSTKFHREPHVVSADVKTCFSPISMQQYPSAAAKVSVRPPTITQRPRRCAARSAARRARRAWRQPRRPGVGQLLGQQRIDRADADDDAAGCAF